MAKTAFLGFLPIIDELELAEILQQFDVLVLDKRTNSRLIDLVSDARVFKAINFNTLTILSKDDVKGLFGDYDTNIFIAPLTDENNVVKPLLMKFYTCAYSDKPVTFTVDRASTISGCIKKKDAFKYNVVRREAANIIVFDLDETLIDEHYDAVYGHWQLRVLGEFKIRLSLSYPDKVQFILWTHGTKRHVYETLRHQDLYTVFDDIITRNDAVSRLPTVKKNLSRVFGSINKKYGIGRLGLTILIDDSPENFDSDYDWFIIPKFNGKAKLRNLKELIREIDLKFISYYKLKQDSLESC